MPHGCCLQSLARRLAEAVSDAEGDPQLVQQLMQALAAATAASAPHGGGHLSPRGEASGAGSSDTAAAAAAAEEDEAPDPLEAAWQAVLVPLATLAKRDPRPRLADAAAAALLQCLRAHGGGFSLPLWRRVYSAALLPLLALPPPELVEEGADDAHFHAGALNESFASVTPLAAVDVLPTAVGDELSFEGIDRQGTREGEVGWLRLLRGEYLLTPFHRRLIAQVWVPSWRAVALARMPSTQRSHPCPALPLLLPSHWMPAGWRDMPAPTCLSCGPSWPSSRWPMRRC